MVFGGINSVLRRTGARRSADTICYMSHVAVLHLTHNSLHHKAQVITLFIGLE